MLAFVVYAASGAPLLVPADATHQAPEPVARESRPDLVQYRDPVPGPLRVLRRFEPPPTPYSAGHRGVDLGAPAASVVLAAATGRVSFAGSVAGRGVVVITHADGIRTEYEPVAPLVSTGELVIAGEPIGRLRGRHGEWPADRCLHWGARRGDSYIDPLLLLAPLGPVRLLPWPRHGPEARAGPARS